MQYNGQKLKDIEVEMLKIFIDICEKNSLKYFLLGGSCIGAIRHKGMIPWDDDIDVGMPREDYDKFLENKSICKIALCYEECLSENRIPVSSDDLPMNYIVTDREVFSFDY